MLFFRRILLVPVLDTILINSSVFVPGGGSPQYGFRGTELIAQAGGNHTAMCLKDDVGASVFHFSIHEDEGVSNKDFVNR